MEGSEERGSFESQWSKAFEGAKQMPSDRVWAGVKGEIAGRQADTFKRKASLYKWMAAASLFLAFSLGVLLFFNDDYGINDENQYQGITESGESVNPNRDDTHPTVDADPSERSSSETHSALSMSNEGGEGKGVLSISVVDISTESSATVAEKEMDRQLSVASINDANQRTDVQHVGFQEIHEQSTFLALRPMKPEVSGIELPSLPGSFYRVPINSALLDIDDSHPDKNTLWAGLNFGSGSFDPNYGLAGESALFTSVDKASPGPQFDLQDQVITPLEEESRPGATLSIGLDVGKQISPKWILQSGFQYGRFRVNSSTNLVLLNPQDQTAVPVSFQNRSDLQNTANTEVSNEQVDINNDFQLVSFPVKAGFVLLDRRFSLFLNGGISGDIYLGNNLASESANVDSYEIDPGSNSPYRRLYLNALTSLQIGYQIGCNYYLSLEPSYHQSLTNFAKQENTFSSRPSRSGLVLGFRYLFK